jgi:hypothetical protein
MKAWLRAKRLVHWVRPFRGTSPSEVDRAERAVTKAHKRLDRLDANPEGGDK